MALLGWLVALGFAAGLALVGGLLIVGGQQALVEELRPGFRRHPASPLMRALVLAGIYTPLGLVVLLIVLTVGRIVAMIFA